MKDSKPSNQHTKPMTTMAVPVMLHPPLPDELKHLSRPGRCPVHLCAKQVATLLEFWGFTVNGEQHVKKLSRCGVLNPVRLTHQRSLRFLTGEVLAVWETEKGA